jgi:hypothetical protein
MVTTAAGQEKRNEHDDRIGKERGSRGPATEAQAQARQEGEAPGRDLAVTKWQPHSISKPFRKSAATKWAAGDPKEDSLIADQRATSPGSLAHR